MCPACPTLALIGTATSTGGVTALVAKMFRAKDNPHRTQIKGENHYDKEYTHQD
jgi:hypothetical protein